MLFMCGLVCVDDELMLHAEHSRAMLEERERGVALEAAEKAVVEYEEEKKKNDAYKVDLPDTKCVVIIRPTRPAPSLRTARARSRARQVRRPRRPHKGNKQTHTHTRVACTRRVLVLLVGPGALELARGVLAAAAWVRAVGRAPASRPPCGTPPS